MTIRLAPYVAVLPAGGARTPPRPVPTSMPPRVLQSPSAPAQLNFFFKRG